MNTETLADSLMKAIKLRRWKAIINQKLSLELGYDYNMLILR